MGTPDLYLILAQERRGPRSPQQLAKAVFVILLQETPLESPQPVSVVHLAESRGQMEPLVPLSPTGMHGDPTICTGYRRATDPMKPTTPFLKRLRANDGPRNAVGIWETLVNKTETLSSRRTSRTASPAPSQCCMHGAPPRARSRHKPGTTWLHVVQGDTAPRTLWLHQDTEVTTYRPVGSHSTSEAM